jgi:GGDEF domain-containing protein
VDPTNDITTADLTLGDEGEDLWNEILPHLSPALSDSEAAFLDALEAAGRGAGLTQRVPVSALLEAYTAGSEQVRELFVRAGDPAADTDARRLLDLERRALTRLAAGYADGQQETIDRLRRLADESSPFDADSGAMKPAEFGERLSLEVERCHRMDLPLGLVELAVDGGEAERHGGHASGARHEVGACLRESLRRYDSVGLTQDGAFVLVLPDISRRGLAGAAERIRREVGTCVPHGATQEMTFALAHYDFVDASAAEMLSALGRGLEEARRGDDPVAWA